MKTLTPIVLYYLFHLLPLAAAEDCARFRHHLNTELPQITDQRNNQVLPLDLKKKIIEWKSDLSFLKNETAYKSWISCIQKYIYLDTDQDGIPDWGAIVDGKPSRILFPLDQDIDGDGISNIHDPNPYIKNSTKTNTMLPKHLEMNKSTLVLQKKVIRDFGILVVNHSDQHHGDVLKIIDDTFQIESIRILFKKSLHLKVIYAMKGRNPEEKIAAYHPSAQAISLPGISSYSQIISNEQKCQLKAALIHELGHAYLFEHVNAEELKGLASQYGSWRFPKTTKLSIMDRIFQRKFIPTTSEDNFVSEYAKENVHEWFAENFAAYIWQKHLLNTDVCQNFKTKQNPLLYSWFKKNKIGKK